MGTHTYEIHQVGQIDTHPQTQAEHLTQLLRTQGLTLVKYNGPDFDGSFSSLLAFLWNCEFLATSPKLTIESVPPIVAEGRSVLLLVHNPPENIAGFVWFKGTTTIDNFVVSQYTLYKKLTVWGPAYGGRETLYSDGSLLLHSVTVKDSGLYILRILWTDMRSQDAQVQLQVDSK